MLSRALVYIFWLENVDVSMWRTIWTRHYFKHGWEKNMWKGETWWVCHRETFPQRISGGLRWTMDFMFRNILYLLRLCRCVTFIYIEWSQKELEDFWPWESWRLIHRLPRVQRPDCDARGPDVELICSQAGRENISSSIALNLADMDKWEIW